MMRGGVRVRGALGSNASSSKPFPLESRLASLERRVGAIGERPPRAESVSLHTILKECRHPTELERAERLLRASALGKNQTLWNSLMEAHGRVGQPAIAEDIF